VIQKPWNCGRRKIISGSTKLDKAGQSLEPLDRVFPPPQMQIPFVPTHNHSLPISLPFLPFFLCPPSLLPPPTPSPPPPSTSHPPSPPPSLFPSAGFRQWLTTEVAFVFIVRPGEFLTWAGGRRGLGFKSPPGATADLNHETNWRVFVFLSAAFRDQTKTENVNHCLVNPNLSGQRALNFFFVHFSFPIPCPLPISLL